MLEINRRWHNDTLAIYNAIMFESLIFKHNIISAIPKIYEFEDEFGVALKDTYRGYFAMKEVDGKNVKYIIEESYHKQMPIRVNKVEEIFYRDSSKVRSVIERPYDITPFKIVPKQCWQSNKKFVDCIAPFEHTHPKEWTLAKILAIMGYVSKTFTGICSLSEFGKSSIYLILNAITQKCPVFQPRSVPGVLAQITSAGNMIFDEVHDAKSEVKDCMESFSLMVAGNSPIYLNGAMKAKNTKAKYSVSNQSITFLYNVFSNYKKPTENFWNFIWKNKKAMESRFLLIKFQGKLLEKFDKDFDIPNVANENKIFYVRLAKHLLYLQEVRLKNKYVRRYVNNSQIYLSARHKIIYNEITWGIDLYSESQQEYDELVIILNNAITGYKDMLGRNPVEIEEEEVK